jgi:hypothetical protein
MIATTRERKRLRAVQNPAYRLARQNYMGPLFGARPERVQSTYLFTSSQVRKDNGAQSCGSPWPRNSVLARFIVDSPRFAVQVKI